MNPHAEQQGLSPKPIIAILGIAVISGLYASSLYSYLLFHSLVELFSILVAFVIFVLAWNTRRVQDNHYLLFLGIALLFTGALEMVHTLSYKDFGVFPGNDANHPTQFWIAFRYLSSASFLVAPLFIRRTLNVPVMVALYAVGTALLIGTIFLGIFPDCFVEGRGLTPFKIVSEYVIIAIFLASLGLLLRERSYFDRGVLRLMIGSIIASILSELSFTQYVSVFGPANMIGHFFLLASMVFIYRAIIVTGIVEPSRLLFRNLKQNEAALRESEAKYRSLFEHMINGFAFHKIIVDEAGKPVDYVFLEANPAFERLTGLKRADITGRRVREVLPGIEKDASDWIGTYGRIALTGQVVQFEQYAEALGKWYSVSAYSPMKGYFATIFEDITERKLSEEALHKAHDVLEQRVRERTADLARANEELESEIAERTRAEARTLGLNRLYSVLSKVNEAIVRIHDPGRLYEQVCRIVVEEGSFKMAWIGLTDPETRLVNVVAKYGDAAGYLDAIKVYAADVPEGRGPTGRAAFEGTYSISSDIEQDPRMLPWSDKARLHGFRSSAAFPLRAGPILMGAFTMYSSKPQFFTDEEIKLLSSLAEDISFAMDAMANEKRRLAAEEDLRRLNEELEQRVSARTMELEAANKELEAFSYSVSHDLRAPLRSIDGFSQAIEEEQAKKLDDTGRDHLRRVRAAADKMTRLIDAMLDLARMSGGELRRVSVDLSALAKKAAEELRRTQPERVVEFVIPSGLTVEGDAVMLRAVVENLLGNAWKFTGKRDTARIEFGAVRRNGSCAFFVRDNGAGFDMALAGKLFKAYQRLHTAEEFSGLGIGLATVQRIVHRHGGKIWAEGEPEKGATFYFTL